MQINERVERLRALLEEKLAWIREQPFVKKWLDKLDNDEKAIEESVTEAAKKAQQRNAWLVIGVVGLILVIYGAVSGGHKADKASTLKLNLQKESAFTSPTDQLDPSAEWLSQAENKLSDEQKTTSTLQKMLLSETASNKVTQSMAAQQQATIDKLAQEVDGLSNQVATLHASHANTPADAGVNHGSNGDAGDGSDNTQDDDTGMRVTTLALLPAPVTPAVEPPKTPDNYIPAGAHAEARLLEGVDAAAGVTAQSDPRPVTLRITGNAVLPSYEHSQLKGCLVTGGAYGDISSERVYIRLEKMSCQRDGQLVEFTVDGHVSGNDGKPGIRGRVVMRDGALVGRAFVGGLFSGLGQAASDNYTDTSVSPLGSTSTVKNGESYEYGAAQGFSNAANMYADYNIKRAEQYQPVLEVGAASAVDIVFANGFYLDGIDNKTHEKNRENDLKNQGDNTNQSLLARVNALENQDSQQDSTQAPSDYQHNNNTGQADANMPQGDF